MLCVSVEHKKIRLKRNPDKKRVGKKRGLRLREQNQTHAHPEGKGENLLPREFSRERKTLTLQPKGKKNTKKVEVREGRKPENQLGKLNGR